VELAEMIGEASPNGLTQGALMMCFKLAFPNIPVRTLYIAAGWRRVGGAELDDGEFNELLGPYVQSPQEG
jgi:hypothetical protein